MQALRLPMFAWCQCLEVDNPHDTNPNCAATVCYLLQNAVLAEKTLKGEVKELEAKMQETEGGMPELQQAHDEVKKVSFFCSSADYLLLILITS